MTVTPRFLAPFALVALGTLAGSPSAHAADAPHFDASVPRPFLVSMRGATSSEAWLTLQAQGASANPLTEAVLDLKSGCIKETMTSFTQPVNVANAATKADIVRFVAEGRRFGLRRLGFGNIANDGLAFSNDGKTIAIAAEGEVVFRSHDGGQTFDRLDANMSRYPAVTADGKWIMYERCSDASRRNQSCPAASREARIVSADDSAPARTIAIGSGLLRGLDPTGQKLVVVRYDLGAEVTVMHVDPSAGTMTRAFGIASTVVQKNRFHDIDPSPKNGAFGLFDDNDVAPTNVLTVISMTDGKLVQRLTTVREMGTETDDESGRVMWQTYPDDHAWARKPGGATVDLGMGDPLGWAPGGRAIIFNAKYANGARVTEPPATLGSVACKIARVTPVN